MRFSHLLFCRFVSFVIDRVEYTQNALNKDAYKSFKRWPNASGVCIANSSEYVCVAFV